MGMVALAVVPLLLGLLLAVGEVDRWSPIIGGIVGFLLLATALFLQFLWVALVIESWQVSALTVFDNGKLQPLVSYINWLVHGGKKTGWLIVGFTTMITLTHIWIMPARNQWLLQAAFWISLFAMIGAFWSSYSSLFLTLFIFPSNDPKGIVALIRAQQIIACLIFVGILYRVLEKSKAKFLTNFLLVLFVGGITVGCSKTQSIEENVPKPTFTSTPIATVAPAIPPTPVAPVLSPTPTKSLPVPGDRGLAIPLTRENVLLPATLYFLGTDGNIWAVDKETHLHQQITHEASPIIDYDFSPVHGRFVFVSDNQLVEFDPATHQRIVKLDTLTEADLWAINENGSSSCAKCDMEQVLAPRYSPDGSQIAFAKGGINLIESGLEKNTPPRLLQANVRFQIDTEDVNATRFYNDSLWSPDGTRIAFHTVAWEWTGYELYDLNQNQLQIVHSLVVPGVHLCCQWQWGKDGTNGYLSAPHGLGPVPDHGIYQVNASDASVIQLNSGENGGELAGQQRGAIGVHQRASGELFAFISVNDEKWITQPTLYSLHRIDPNGGEPMAVNDRQIFIEGEVLWAPDGSGALVMTASFSPSGAAPVGKFVWLQNSAEYSYPQPLTLIGSHLRWGN